MASTDVILKCEAVENGRPCTLSANAAVLLKGWPHGFDPLTNPPIEMLTNMVVCGLHRGVRVADVFNDDEWFFAQRALLLRGLLPPCYDTLKVEYVESD